MLLLAKRFFLFCFYFNKYLDSPTNNTLFFNPLLQINNPPRAPLTSRSRKGKPF